MAGFRPTDRSRVIVGQPFLAAGAFWRRGIVALSGDDEIKLLFGSSGAPEHRQRDQYPSIKKRFWDPSGCIHVKFKSLLCLRAGRYNVTDTGT